jgi:maltose-binding protein MalE
MLHRILIRMIGICVGIALLTAAQCAAPATPEIAVVEETEEKPVEKTVTKAPGAETEVVTFVVWGTGDEFERQKLNELKAKFEESSGHKVNLIFLSER